MSGLRSIPRDGAVLPMALAIMVIIGLAAGTALFTGRQERQSSWNTRLQTTALGAADRAAADLFEALARVASSIDVGASVSRQLDVSPSVVATVRLTRLGPTLFVLTSDAGARSAQGLAARRHTSLLLRLDPPALGVPAALTVVGPSPPDVALADGTDVAPGGWPCDAPKPDTAAIAHPSPAPDTSTLRALRGRASIQLADGTVLRDAHPTVSDGVCDTARPDNLGDPDRAGACTSWLPVVHATGDLTVDGGTGQGILLVDGSLTVGGGFRFVGLLLVGGDLQVASGGASISGGVVAGSIADASGSAPPVPIVRRSTCAIESALIAAGDLRPVPDRPWTFGR
jgi:hypothetical protein